MSAFRRVVLAGLCLACFSLGLAWLVCGWDWPGFDWIALVRLFKKSMTVNEHRDAF